MTAALPRPVDPGRARFRRTDVEGFTVATLPATNLIRSGVKEPDNRCLPYGSAFALVVVYHEKEQAESDSTSKAKASNRARD